MISIYLYKYKRGLGFETGEYRKTNESPVS